MASLREELLLRPLLRLSILFLPLAILHAQTGSSEPGGLLSHLTVAQFVGSGQESIQAMTSDAAGNIYVAGTTSSPDLPMKNAAQPAIGEAPLMRSVDRGVTWQKVPYPPTFPVTITPHPSDPLTLFLGGRDGIYKTGDGGQTWRQVYKSTSSYRIVIDPANSRQTYAYVTGAYNSPAFLMSGDGGETWQSPAAPRPDGGGLWVDPNGSGTVGLGLWLSRDHGLTWTRMTAPPTGTPTFTVPDPRHAGWIYVATSAGTLGRLYLSTNWGMTWTERPSPRRPPGPEPVAIGDLLFDPDLPNVMYAPDIFGSLDISDDGGASWRASGGFAFLDFQYRPALLSRQCMGGALVAVSGQRIVSSLDFGATWQRGQLSLVDLATGPECAVYVAKSMTSDAFVAKLAPGGGEVLWSTFLGGSEMDTSAALALDAQGNVYVAGNTASADFPSTAPRIGTQGRQNVFAVKLDPDGRLIYSVVLGGEASEAVTGLAVNGQGELHLSGWTTSKSFPATIGAFQTQAGASDGFAVKLAADGTIAYASYLPDLAPDFSSRFGFFNPPRMVGVAAEASGSALFGGYGGTLLRMSPDGSSLVTASRQPGQIYTMETDSEGNTYVAGQTVGGGSRSCFGGFTQPAVPAGDIFVTKLRSDTLEQIFSARLFGDCQSRPGALRIGPTGEITVGAWTYGTFPVRNPVLPLPTCNAGPAVISRLSADGSARLFSSYLDMCAQAPALALAPDGSIYAGVMRGLPYQPSPAGVLKLPVLDPGGISVERAVNAFSGFLGFATAGMLLTITGQNLSPASIDLGLNDPNPLPRELGGVQVLFDGTPAEMFQVAPDHLICVVPAGVKDQVSVRVQVISGAQMATPFALPFSPFCCLGLLTRSFPNLPPSGSVDGNIRNADGSLNDAQHPAAPGSTVTLFGTGLTGPGPVPLVWNAPPPQRYELIQPLSGMARRMPGFIDAIYAIDFRIPDSPGVGVYLVPKPGVLTRAEIGRVGSGLGVYVK